jgi:peroxiredoxin Q/BCP
MDNSSTFLAAVSCGIVSYRTAKQLAFHYRIGYPMSDWIEEGAKAPAFTLKADDGSKVKLSDLKGQPVVIYFYPKDDTPGCTKEACAFRDRSDELAELGAKVFGVSTDSVESHVKFKQKYQLNFPLLSDPEHAMAEKYGAWREKNMYGKKSMGIQRSTYLIDAEGKVVKVWKKVSVDGHDQQVIDALKELAS